MKSEKIECGAKVIKAGNSIVGIMPWETPYIIFQTPWGKRKWQSDTINSSKLKEGDIVWLSAFVRKDTGNLFRVIAIKITK